MAVNQGAPIGAVPEVTAKFYTTSNGVRALEDPGIVTVTVESPSGTESNPTAVQQSKGIYTASFTLTEAGLWHYRITGDAPAAGAVEGDVLAADSQVLDSDPAADYTYDPTADIGIVRLLIDDRDFTSISSSTPRGERSAIFDDAEIQAFITQETESSVVNTYRASGIALLAIAASRQLMVKRRELDGANVDFGDLRRDLRLQATEYFKLGDELSGGQDAPADGVAEVNHGEFSEAEIIINSWLRQGY